MSSPPVLDAARAEARRIAVLRLELLDCHPFWGHLLLHVQFVPTTGLTTFAATDCTRYVWFNPQLTQHLDLRQLGFVLVHEMGHHLFESLSRREGRDPHLWNCATDYAINRMVMGIVGEGGTPLYRLPDGPHPLLGAVRSLHDRRFSGMTAEQIYETLRKETPRPPATRLMLQLPGGPGERNVADHHGGIDVHLPVRQSEQERGALMDRLTSAVKAHQEQGQRGHIPCGVERLVAGLQPAKVPWHHLLARFVGEAQTRQQYSTGRPNRRWLLQDIVVPGLVSDEPGRIVVAVDTSASITPPLLRAIASELAKLHTITPELTVLIADAEVHAEVPTQSLLAFLQQQTFKGGGGTDHKPVFEWIAKRRLQPELFIGLTDLFSQFPTVKPTYPVVWVVPKAHGLAPWGKVFEADLPL